MPPLNPITMENTAHPLDSLIQDTELFIRIKTQELEDLNLRLDALYTARDLKPEQS